MSPQVEPNEAKRVTLATVARHAQVHVSTASRALSDDPAGVGADTVRRVRELAEMLGYRRDAGAAALRTGSSRLIGVLVHRLTDLALATMYDSIDAAAAAAGYSAVVANTLDDPAHRSARLDALMSRRVDGIIIADSHLGDTVGYDLQRRGIPYVLAMRTLPGLLSVSTDDHTGGRLAAEHLHSLGHTRVAVIAGDLQASTGIERSQGFLRFFEAAGHPVPEDHVVSSGFGTAAGRSAGEKLMALPKPPTAIFAVDDLTAIGAMGAIREAGLRLRDDVALVGYNDIDLAANLPVPLTSVRSDLEEMGRLAVDALLRRINGQEATPILLPPVLVPRATTVP
ncbi:LacI family DNA-binding transcriptional regulator [Arthrobacter subterraneus]|uniref:LacI family DNA-binding transcriptional regulator n=1 Tax=Arthrobacter subterraneus TaxID=335973 RepID=UPI0038179261